jgi:hypothetical protein
VQRVLHDRSDPVITQPDALAHVRDGQPPAQLPLPFTPGEDFDGRLRVSAERHRHGARRIERDLQGRLGIAVALGQVVKRERDLQAREAQVPAVRTAEVERGKLALGRRGHDRPAE